MMMKARENDVEGRRRRQTMRSYRYYLPLSQRQLVVIATFLVALSYRKYINRSSQHRAELPAFRSERETLPKILYIITSLREYDDGSRATNKGHDRFLNSMVPIAAEGVRTMVDAGFRVDLFLIADYEVTDARRQQLMDAMPSSTGLEFWGDATPLYYPEKPNKHRNADPNYLSRNTMGLARQHRYVIKDKLPYYDMFVNFEDDMFVTGAHVQHFMNVSDELYRLQQEAPKVLPDLPDPSEDDMASRYHGPMTKAQLSRMIPGFIRVEATPSDFAPVAPDIFENVTQDYELDAAVPKTQIDPTVCCHMEMESKYIPTRPSFDSLYMWETSLDAVSLRKMPESSDLGWVLLQAGNSNRNYMFPKSSNLYVMGDYWTGQSGLLGNNVTVRPDREAGRYANNQGGWMGSKRQVFQWHTRRCTGGFLPPFGPPPSAENGELRLDGQRSNVEFWSGSMQMFGRKGCKLQRMIMLDPDGFSKQLLYHTSNNKQIRAIVRNRLVTPEEINSNDSVRKQFATGNIQRFWGQLNAIRKHAETTIAKKQ